MYFYQNAQCISIGMHCISIETQYFTVVLYCLFKNAAFIEIPFSRLQRLLLAYSYLFSSPHKQSPQAGHRPSPYLPKPSISLLLISSALLQRPLQYCLPTFRSSIQLVILFENYFIKNLLLCKQVLILQRDCLFFLFLCAMLVPLDGESGTQVKG